MNSDLTSSNLTESLQRYRWYAPNGNVVEIIHAWTVGNGVFALIIRVDTKTPAKMWVVSLDVLSCEPRVSTTGAETKIYPASTPTEPGWYLAKGKPSWVYPDGESGYGPRQVVELPGTGEVVLVVPEENGTYHSLDLFEWGSKVT